MAERDWITKFAAVRYFLGGCETYFVAATAWYYIKSLGQTEIFLAFVLSSYNFGAIISGPLFGFITDRCRTPKCIFIFCCVMKVFAYIIYSVNLSPYFPLFGRLISGLSNGGVAILLGQVTLQTNEKQRGGKFIFLEGIYILGSAFGPGIGSFITFRINVFGWEINDGNSPGIVLTIVWFLFLVGSLLLPNDVWVDIGSRNKCAIFTTSDSEHDERLSECDQDRDQNLNYDSGEKKQGIMCDSRIFCLYFLIFSNEVFSSTSTFYVPVLGLDHFHLQVIHVKLLFLNSTIFTLLVFLCFYFASEYADERKLFLFALFLQITAISFLTSLAFSWDKQADVHYYTLLFYICLGMPYFAYPFGNSILSKVTSPQNASFVQGLSYATVHSAIVISRILVSSVVTETSLICYCMALVFIWLVGFIWYSVLYKKLLPKG